MVKAHLAKCEECPLKDEPFVPGSGDGSGVIIVGEGPGEQEVQFGKPFVGPSGQLLDRVISAVGGEPTATWRTNVVLCRPPANREPTQVEISCCKDRLLAEIGSIPGAVIVAAGKTARDTLLGSDATNGVLYTSPDLPGKEIMPMWHPAYVLRKPSAFEELKRNLSNIYTKPDGLPEVAYTIIDTYEELEEALDAMTEVGEVSFDFETNQINWMRDGILCLAMTSWEDGAFILTDDLLYDDPAAQGLLKEFFQSDIEFIGHHAKFDLHFLWHQVFEGEQYGRVDFDTLVAHYAIVEQYPHDLKTLLAWYFGWPDYEKDLVQRYLKKRSDEYSKVPPKHLFQYGSLDVCGTLKLKRRLESELELRGVRTLFDNILMPATMMLCRMEHRGMAVDTRFLEKMQGVMGGEMIRLTSIMVEMAQHDFNPNAWQQVQTVIYDELGLPPNPSSRSNIKRRNENKEGYSTAIDALEHLASVNPKTRIKVRDGDPFVDVLFEYRRVAKLKGTYADNLIDASRGATDGRVHATANVHGTEVGRLSFSDPPLQTIPRPDEHWGRVIRSAFVAGPGCLLIHADYAQAEWRVFAAESRDPFLIDVFEHDRDLHSEVATALYGPSFTKAQRVMAKMFNFAWIYGGTEHSFAQDAGMPLNEAQAWVREYNKLMSVAVQWRRDQFMHAKEHNWVKTRTGRYRRFPLITRKNLNEIRKASTHAVVAGGASDMTLLSCIEAEPISLVLTVHDSIIAETEESLAEVEGEVLRQIMLDTASKWYPEVQWKVDLDILPRWVEKPETLTPPSLLSPNVEEYISQRASSRTT